VTKNYTYTEKTPAHRASDEHAIKHPGDLYGLAWCSHYNGFIAGDAHGYQRALTRIAALEDELASMWTDELTRDCRDDYREQGIYPLAQEVADRIKSVRGE